MKNIQTHNANLDLAKKFLDYAHIANASYALLHHVHENAEQDIKNNVLKSDGLTFKDKLESDIEFEDKINNKKYIKLKGTNTAYACAIEARFAKDKIYKTTLGFINSKLDNNPANVSLDTLLSKDTIEFTNRYELLAHEPNRKQTRKTGYSLRVSCSKLKDKGYSMQKLKKFYKIYTIIVGLLSLFAMVAIGPNRMSLGETLFIFVSLPILFYGTFIFFSNKIFKKKVTKQLSEDEVQDEKAFKILCFVTLAIFIFALFLVNR